MRILITDEIDHLLIKLIKQNNLEFEFNITDSSEKILQSIKQFDGIIVRNRIKIDSYFLHKAKNLKFIARYGSGLESIDLETAEKLNIQCFNSAEGNSNAVGEHCLGILLSLFHKICYSGNQVKNHVWKREENRGVELENKIIGIIGYGNTGKSFAKKLKGFNCSVVAYDKYKAGFNDEFAKEVAINYLYENCDIISLHVPLNKETKYLINHQFIFKMKKPFYLLNTSRGSIVSNRDLIMGLKNEKVLGAGLDVIENENFKFNSIEVDENFEYLLNCNNVIITPHIAGLSIESSKKLSKTLIHKILKLI